MIYSATRRENPRRINLSVPFSLTAIITAAVLIMGLPAGVPALRAQGTAADYQRAAELSKRWTGLVANDRVQPHWSPDSHRFWYRANRGGGRAEFVTVHTNPAGQQPAFDHTALAAALSAALGRPIAADRLPFAAIDLDTRPGSVLFETKARQWAFDFAGGRLRDLGPVAATAPTTPPTSRPPPPNRPGIDRSLTSPDGRLTVSVREGNLWLRDTAPNAPPAWQLSWDASDQDAYSPQVTWSPTGSHLVAIRTRRPTTRQIPLVEARPADQLQPRWRLLDYAKPGDPLPQPTPVLFDLATRRAVPITNAELFENPWSISEVRWSITGRAFTFAYNRRGHQVLRIIAVELPASADQPATARALIDERSDTFLDYAGKRFVHYADATGEILWMSQRSGWNHLYLIEAATGRVKAATTAGSWVVRGVQRVDETTRQIWFTAGGIWPDQDPYHVHHARVGFDGRGLTILTDGDGTHELTASPDGRWLIDSWSRADHPPVIELRRAADGAKLLELQRAQIDDLRAAGWRPPQRFVAKGRDGTTDIYGLIWRPTTFDPLAPQRYPVIEHIYAGPHSAHVPKSFRPFRSVQAFAELGFVIVQIDGMGTSHRSKAFHDVCWRNLADSGFPDRIAWLAAAAAAHPECDLTRVGIYGGSAGGQSALRALLDHGDFYSVAAADCGCHDNRMDKVWWNELWMGYPLGPHYHQQSNATQAHRLRGKLLLTVGELDTNVDPASTLQVVDALIKADKDFELIVVPGAGHGVGESPYCARRRADFFVRHLLGVEPRRP